MKTEAAVQCKRTMEEEMKQIFLNSVGAKDTIIVIQENILSSQKLPSTKSIFEKQPKEKILLVLTSRTPKPLMTSVNLMMGNKMLKLG